MMSPKKLFAVLAALPLAASAQSAAPAPAYQIYGTLNLNYMVTAAPGAFKAPGSSIKPRESVSTDSTNIGIKGTVDTGQFGLGVVYQCETQANLDGVATATLCGRNSRLGLSSAFGTLFFGNWDSPYKGAAYGTKADDAFGNTDVYDEGSIIGSPGSNTRSNAGQTGAAPAALGAANQPALTFNVRAANSVAYHSPKFMGLGVKLQYSVSEFADAKYRRAPELYSAAVNYDNGPISVFAAYEDHEDWLSQTSRDTGIKVGAGYSLDTPVGTTTLGAKWEQLAYEDKSGSGLGTANLKKYDRQAVAIDAKQRLGNHEFRARYIYADAGNAKLLDGTKVSTAGRGAQNFALGYAYYLSSAAQLYAYYTQIENERAAQYTFSTSGPAFDTNVPAGADPWAVGLGLRYAF